MNNLKKLPIGIQTFSEIREKEYIYIDKTQEAYNLIDNYKYAFLSRPRRFGKSLFLSTIKEIFEGNQTLFEGLDIYNKWDWEDKYPVIKIDFSGDLRSSKNLENRIHDILISNQKNLKVECEKIEAYDSCFEELIKKTYQKYNKPVVVLIDEYDKAILDNLDQIEIANANRETLRAFYSILKGCDKYIRFVLLTGVSKFSRASIFSGLNMLEDISLTPKFGNICGYTQNNIETIFKPYLQGVDLEKLKSWYNGYNFLKDKVYNPFNILLFIKNENRFNNYWFKTGTPNFLIQLLKEGKYNLAEFEDIEVGEELLDSFDLENLSLETVMFQSGYLTIKEIEEFGDNCIYHLHYPNLEVKKSFNDYILTNYFIQKGKKTKVQIALYKLMAKSDLEGLKDTLISLFASIAYNNFSKNYIKNYEGFYASVIYAYFVGAGFENVISEDITNHGRIDLSIFIGNKIYIFEFKVDTKGALEQIKEKNYYQKYLSSYNEIYIVGIEFDSVLRNIVGYNWKRVK
ncbi:MAG TPA: hypothetical protein ENK88_04500 [Campylobacterales bacterium]|nr:hypothetical protein [Campylobacterales bacterium]HHD80051.1 hypothetical protein [Campylobacterales bacterium]